MFNSRRFEKPAASNDSYSFVTIQNPACKPAKVMHSEMGGGTVYINAIPITGRDGKPNTKEMISFRAQNKAALRSAIEEKYEASFSSSGMEEETKTVKSATAAKEALKSIREQARPVTEREISEALNRLIRVYGRGVEITEEMCRRESISEAVFNALHRKEQAKFVDAVTVEHRKIAAELSDEEQKNLTAANVHSFVTESPWKGWFEDCRQKNNGNNFLGFPDYTNANYKTLIAYCDAQGWTVPLSGELDKAMRYLLARSHFYLQHTYPRTHRDAYRAVRPFTGVIEEERKPINEHQAAMDSMKNLNSRQLKESMRQMIRNQNLSEDELRRRGSLLR